MNFLKNLELKNDYQIGGDKGGMRMVCECESNLCKYCIGKVLQKDAEIARLRGALEKIRDFTPHPSECDEIHAICNAALAEGTEGK